MRKAPRAVAAASAAVLLAGCAALPSGATAQSQHLHEDWLIFFWFGVAVAAIVYVLILLPLVRWRRRSHEPYPPQFNQNVPLEIGYTVVPLLIVVYLFSVSYSNEVAVDALAAQPDVTVDVTAYDWSWRFRYPGTRIDIAGTPQSPPQLVLPVGKTTRINLTSADVNHAFWVPAFLFKRDAIAGVINRFDFTPLRVGIFRGECAEFCGLDHADMTFTVRVVDDASFSRWLRSQGT
jgi:cytochrome c oxidase subunit II